MNAFPTIFSLLTKSISRRLSLHPRTPIACGLILLFASVAWAQDPSALRRGSYAAFTGEGEILSPGDQVVRLATEGEVVRVRAVQGGWAEVGSALEDLPGGKTKIDNLKPSTAEASTAWIAIGTARLEAARKKVENQLRAPTNEEDIALEAAEALRKPISPVALPRQPKFKDPVIGWFAPGRGTKIFSLQRGADGSFFLSGTVAPPYSLPGVRGWQRESPDGGPGALPFLARIAPDLKTIPDFVVFLPTELGSIDQLQFDPEGGVWAAARGAGDATAGIDAGQGDKFLLRFSNDLRKITRVIPLSHEVTAFAGDSRNRPVVLRGSPGRSGGGLIARYFSEGRFERNWPEAPDGPTRRLALDFSSPALAEGPFALWAKKAEVYPDFPTPIGPWGSAPNAGQPVVWTNVNGGQNPIRGADLKPEALAIDHDDNILVAGTIPFNMGNPDFDPFLMSFSPTGKPLWTNCFLTGLLSEPDQKTQGIVVDPSNGDILISFWQHGNNKQTLLVDPAGWLNKFTGTSGNIKISWIARVDAKTGRLKNSTYLYAQMPDSPNKKWPNLNSAGISAMTVDEKGCVYLGGETTISFPTTDNAFLPVVGEYGIHPMFAVLKPDLSSPVYSTYVSAGVGSVQHLALLPGAVLLVGKHAIEGTPLPVTDAGAIGFLSANPPQQTKEGIFFAILPVPPEETGWNFQH